MPPSINRLTAYLSGKAVQTIGPRTEDQIWIGFKDEILVVRRDARLCTGKTSDIEDSHLKQFRLYPFNTKLID